MKNLFSVIAVMALAFSASAQFIAGPQKISATTNTGAILVAGSFTTNLPSSAQRLIPIGKNGNGFFIEMGGTNAATTTNATIVLEHVIYDTSGNSHTVDNQTYTLSVPQGGTSGYDYFTNLVPTTANIGNSEYLRVKSIQNTNLASIWITNFISTVRE